MATKQKPTVTVKTAQAFSRVLEQQTGAKKWGSTEHAAALGYLAESCIQGDFLTGKDGKPTTEKNPDAGKFDRKGFTGIVNKDTAWLYASNFKKLLIELGELDVTEITTGGYE